VFSDRDDNEFVMGDFDPDRDSDGMAIGEDNGEHIHDDIA
jgi:hypothetical protein